MVFLKSKIGFLLFLQVALCAAAGDAGASGDSGISIVRHNGHYNGTPVAVGFGQTLCSVTFTPLGGDVFVFGTVGFINQGFDITNLGPSAFLRVLTEIKKDGVSFSTSYGGAQAEAGVIGKSISEYLQLYDTPPAGVEVTYSIVGYSIGNATATMSLQGGGQCDVNAIEYAKPK